VEGVIRAEVVGSMLRPAELLQAREQVAAGAITRTEFKRIEDRAVDEAIALQERAGVEVVTDGELRRLSFVGPLTDTVDGVRPIEGAKVAWHDEEGEKPNLQPAIVERLSPRRSLVTEEYAVLDRAGRLQLPAAFVEQLELRDRVRLNLEPDHVEVRPGHSSSSSEVSQ